MKKWRWAAVLAAALTSGGRAQEPRVSQETTPIFVCGQDETSPRLPLHWTNVVLAGDGRLYSPCPDRSHGPEHREVREAVLIRDGRFSGNPEMRFRGAQALARNSTEVNPNFPLPMVQEVSGIGGFITSTIVRNACDEKVHEIGVGGNSRRWQPGNLFMLFRDGGTFAGRGASREAILASFERRDAIRREGAYALGTELSKPGLNADLVSAATRELRVCYENNPNATFVPGLVMNTLGLTRYRNDADVTATEDYLVQATYGDIAKTFGAVKGLEVLQRQHPDHRLGDNARIRLRQLVTYRPRMNEIVVLEADARIRRLALITLQRAGDRDLSTLAAAGADPDWQMRRLVAASLDLSDSQYGALAQQLASDPAFQVRYEMLGPIARQATRAGRCAPLIDYFSDASPIVVMRAMDLLSPTCTDIETATTRLVARADELGKLEKEQWHVGMRALITLSRFKPAEVRPKLEVAVKHLTWQVRAAAASFAANLGEERAVLELVTDPEPNVQSAALEALLRLRSPAVFSRAIFVLENDADYQLLRTAANVLRGVPQTSRNDAANALLGALGRLTGQESDTSAATRIAILERLAEILPAARHAELLPFVVDVDEEVRKVAIRTYNALMHEDPPAAPIKKRYPYQPRPEALLALPSTAVLQFEGGTVTLRLLTDAAPVTVARFAALVAQGYYNGRTFHRIVPNFVVQTGSPADNDFAGVRRFMRDEFSAPGEHIRGAVGMSNRGPDKGDGQFFIDLVDLPHLDRTYTVFAYVTQGMELVDQLLEGTKVLKVSVK